MKLTDHTCSCSYLTFFGYKAHAIHGIEVIKPAEIGLKKTREIASSELIFGEFRTFGTTVQQSTANTRTALWSFFLQNQARTIQTHKTVFENSFFAMFISQVSSKLRDKHCQIT